MDDTRYVAAYRKEGIKAVNRLLQAQSTPAMVKQLEALESTGRWEVRFHHLSRQGLPSGMVVGFRGDAGEGAQMQG